MNKLITAIIAITSVVTLSFATPALAACTTAASCIDDGIGAAGQTSSKTSIGDIIKNVVLILLYVLGAAAVIMIVIGGIKYTTSQGDANGVTSAKNTILYAVVGLIVALMSYAIVNWVVAAFK